MTTVLFATCRAVPSFTPSDALAAAALSARGLTVRSAIWDSTEPRDLDAGTVVVMRSVWDYHLHADRFRGWITGLEHRRFRVFNSPALSRWNMDKGYLRDLRRGKIETLPTSFVPKGERTTLAHELGALGAIEAVVKPAISASAHDTWRTSLAAVADDEARFTALLARGAVLVQEYTHTIESEGEWSLVFLAGRFSHAVRKRPKAGDFRVQREHGGTATLERAPAAVIAAASRVLDALDEVPLFARVDGIEIGGRFTLMELECLDPELFFELVPHAAESFAAALVAAI
ncbi:MAG: hypothetical protein ABJD07_13680 [Gemmatimonadaceae bacterium]